MIRAIALITLCALTILPGDVTADDNTSRGLVAPLKVEGRIVFNRSTEEVEHEACAEIIRVLANEFSFSLSYRLSDASQDALIRIYRRCRRVGADTFLQGKDPSELGGYFNVVRKNAEATRFGKSSRYIPSSNMIETLADQQANSDYLGYSEPESLAYVSDAIELGRSIAKSDHLLDDREIAVLFGYAIGAKPSELADIIGVSPSNLSHIIRRANEKMNRALRLHDVKSVGEIAEEGAITIVATTVGLLIGGAVFFAVFGAFSVLLKPLTRLLQNRVEETSKSNSSQAKRKTMNAGGRV